MRNPERGAASCDAVRYEGTSAGLPTPQRPSSERHGEQQPLEERRQRAAVPVSWMTATGALAEPRPHVSFVFEQPAEAPLSVESSLAAAAGMSVSSSSGLPPMLSRRRSAHGSMTVSALRVAIGDEQTTAHGTCSGSGGGEDAAGGSCTATDCWEDHDVRGSLYDVQDLDDDAAVPLPSTAAPSIRRRVLVVSEELRRGSSRRSLSTPRGSFAQQPPDHELQQRFVYGPQQQQQSFPTGSGTTTPAGSPRSPTVNEQYAAARLCQYQAHLEVANVSGAVPAHPFTIAEMPGSPPARTSSVAQLVLSSFPLSPTASTSHTPREAHPYNDAQLVTCTSATSPITSTNVSPRSGVQHPPALLLRRVSHLQQLARHSSLADETFPDLRSSAATLGQLSVGGSPSECGGVFADTDRKRDGLEQHLRGGSGCALAMSSSPCSEASSDWTDARVEGSPGPAWRERVLEAGGASGDSASIVTQSERRHGGSMLSRVMHAQQQQQRQVLHNRSNAESFAFLMLLPNEILRYMIDHFLPVRMHFTMRSLSLRWNAIVISNCTLWHRRLPRQLFSRDVRRLLDACRVHNTMAELYRAELALQVADSAREFGAEHAAAVAASIEPESADSSEENLRVERVRPRTEEHIRRLRATFCFSGCCHKAWRADRLARADFLARERVNDALVSAAARACKACFFPNVSSGTCTAFLVVLCMLCLGSFWALLQANGAELHFAFIPLWAFFLILYPLLYAFFAASHYSTAIAAFFVAFTANISALIAFFLAEREASTSEVVDGSSLIVIAPLAIALVALATVSVKCFIDWFFSRGVAMHPVAARPRSPAPAPSLFSSGSSSSSPNSTVARVVSARAALIAATTTMLPVLLLLTTVAFAVELDAYRRGPPTPPARALPSGGDDGPPPANISINGTAPPLQAVPGPAAHAFIVSGCGLATLGSCTVFVIVMSTHVLNIFEIFDEEPAAGTVLAAYTLGAGLVAVAGLLVAADVLHPPSSLAFRCVAGAAGALMGLTTVANALFPKEPDREWWLGYALYPD